MIPKLIHQIWFQGKENMPDHLKEYHESWVKNNPDYHIIVWDEQKINKEVDKFFDTSITELYYSYDHMIQKIDLAKYIILYKYGGAYIDMDTKSLKRLDDSFFQSYDLIVSKLPDTYTFRCFLALGGNSIFSETINNGAIIACIENKVILETIYEAKRNKNSIYKNVSKTLYVYISTGPICLTNATYNYISNNPNHKIKIVNNTYFEGCDVIEIENNNCKIPDNAIGIHLYENSWITDNENSIKKFLGFLIKYLKYIIIFIVLIIVSLVIYYFKSVSSVKKNKK